MSLGDFARNWGPLLLGLGVDPRRFRHIMALPRLLRDARAFRRRGGVIGRYAPILHDYGEQAGVGQGQYFHMDLLVAQFVAAANPRRHVDVGSRIDGFVAHVAAFRAIDVIDVRPLGDIGHPNIRFVQADLSAPQPDLALAADSVSCLHAIEHFGLGRYGDPIDPDGHLRGFANLVAMLEPGGRLYLAVPIGPETHVQFNAQRVFAAPDVPGWPGADGLTLIRFDHVDADGRLHRDQPLAAATSGCGIYSFEKQRLPG